MATFCFQCVIIFGIKKKQRNFNYLQDNYLIKLKFSPEVYFDVVMTKRQIPIHWRLKKFMGSLWRHFSSKTLEILHEDFS